MSAGGIPVRPHDAAPTAPYAGHAVSEPEDVHGSGGWTTLPHEAGIVHHLDADAGDCSKRLRQLLHVDEPTESPANGWRTAPDASHVFLGPVPYEGHRGDGPIGIHWGLERGTPLGLFERFDIGAGVLRSLSLPECAFSFGR